MEGNEISQEGKESLLNQLEGLMGRKPCFYLKFCGEEKFAKDICDGNFYSNTAKYFREIEVERGERGQGDMYELVLPIKMEKISMFDYETGDLVFQFKGGDGKFQYKSDDVIPLVSFVGIPLRDMVFVEADEHHAVFQFPFTEKEYANMVQRFGPYCVIIGARELEHRIETVCNQCGFDYVFDSVEYCKDNRIDRMQAFANSRKERFLYKNIDLKYQREYRLAVAIEIPENHFLNFGQLETAHILTSDKLQNLALSVEYESHMKGE